MRYDLPQKLTIQDTGVIYFRRQLAQRARDFKRLGGAAGSKHPPTRTAAEWRQGAGATPAPATKAEIGAG